MNKKKSKIIFLFENRWSLIDSYVMCMLLVSFRFHVDVISELINIDIIVHPKWGFYGFIIATILSLIWTHIIIHFHRH
jgi:hypothetical protein